MIYAGTGCHDSSGGGTCCTSENKCGVGEGDCDKDADCHGTLKCGVDNCDTRHFPVGWDCCYAPVDGNFMIK